MEQSAATNPFQPGAGSYPPVLAGRAEELAQLASLVRTLADWRPGRPLQPIHLIEAPRGMGKTVLLETLARLAETDSELGGVTVAHTPASNLATVDDIAGHVEPTPSRYQQAWRWFAGLKWLGLHLQRPGEPADGRRAMQAAFERRTRRPLLLMVDEAHALPPDVCHVLLNEFQTRSGRQPCALVLAGTPALRAYLLSDEVNASFIERAPVIAPGLLPPEDAATALRVPAWNAWDIHPATLDTAVDESHGYPYFLQHWGKALWDAGVARRVIDQATLDVARGGRRRRPHRTPCHPLRRVRGLRHSRRHRPPDRSGGGPVSCARSHPFGGRGHDPRHQRPTGRCRSRPKVGSVAPAANDRQRLLGSRRGPLASRRSLPSRLHRQPPALTSRPPVARGPPNRRTRGARCLLPRIPAGDCGSVRQRQLARPDA